MEDTTADEISFLRGASARGRSRVLQHTQLVSLEEGTHLFHEGDPPEYLYVIRDGEIDIVVTLLDGSEEVQRTLGPGRILGELGILGGHARTATARAVKASEVWAIDRNAFLELYENEPAVGVEIASSMATYLLDADVIAEDLLFLDLRGRVAKRLLGFLDVSGSGVYLVTATEDMSAGDVESTLQRLARAMGGEPEPYSELDRLALLSGGSRAAVARLLGEMQRDGVLISTEGNLIVIDKTKLEEQAQHR